MDLIQAFILGMIVMLAICIVPGVTEEIRKNGLKPGKRVYCKDCQYCDLVSDDEKDWFALCRLNSPKNADWPTRYIEDWCGEGVRKEQ